ncbi:glycoside hydrolase family 31 protein [Stemphylium lycopersici]|uniref:alpha-glucosidase n=1 Tax=Stemphylium lycopersici TaxID=183478 RepID=A0A364N168_STELY|nr:glycoside hydrolase family 31 protein [Stemphylium lycopersici]
MLNRFLLGITACSSLIHAVPIQQDLTDLAAALTRRVAIDSCPGYTASNVVENESSFTADLTLAGDACNAFSDDIKDLKVLVEYQTDERLHVKIYDADQQVFQVQEEVFPRPKNEKATVASSALQFGIRNSPFSFAVKRSDNGEVLFDTGDVPLVFEKQYVRLRTKLPDNPNIYGLGEHSDSFRFHTDDYERVLLNAESPNIPTNANLYGSHPVYFDHRGDNGTHGVFMLNSSPMQVDVKKDESGSQYLEYNMIGGVIDLYFMAGSKPAEVSKQYADIAGYSAMYPYWTFGFHQCKYGYWDVNMVAEVVGNYSTAGIPLEVMWTDIDYMHLREDFTTDPERFPLSKMRELVSTLHSRDQRYVLILDPGVHAVGDYPPYQKGQEMDVFLKAADGSDMLGVQWPGEVAWPDWFAPNTQEWWTEQIMQQFNSESGIDLDGLWVDMNEASNFCHDPQTCKPRQQAIDDNIPPKPSHPPRENTGRPIPGFPASFQPSGNSSVKARHSQPLPVRQPLVEISGRQPSGVVAERQSSGDMKGFPDRNWFDPAYHVNSHLGDVSRQTIPMNTTNYDGSWQYDTHNLYSHMMAATTRESMLSRRPELRPFVLTRSTFAGTGRKVAHWFGDNFSSWEHYRTSIRQMLSFVSMHQMPMVGSDVCGFNGNADKYMCARWALLGAFQPFYRNHAELSTIQQEFYQWPVVASAAKKAIEVRYKLMDYIYTALYYQTQDGTPMINPLFFLYPSDSNTFGLQEQWFYGDALLISPVTTDYSDTVTFYLPNDLFYDYWTYAKVEGQGQNVTQSNLTYNDIPVHIRGGSIIPHRINSANTTKALRKEDFYILVAPDADGKASGRLYLDDGESLEQPAISEIAFSYESGKFSATGSFDYAASGGESVTVAKVVVLGQDKEGASGTFDADKKTVEVTGPWKMNGEFGFSL